MDEAKVGIVMGSRSDEEAMSAAAKTLEKFNIPYEIVVTSSHRNPERTAQYGLSAESRGLKVIIAGAGLSAGLPGTLAANTLIPVIGVPIDVGPLSGADALYAIVQMPRGVPVATVGIGNSANAAILAAQIIALSNEGVRKKLLEYRAEMSEK